MPVPRWRRSAPTAESRAAPFAHERASASAASDDRFHAPGDRRLASAWATKRSPTPCRIRLWRTIAIAQKHASGRRPVGRLVRDDCDHGLARDHVAALGARQPRGGRPPDACSTQPPARSAGCRSPTTAGASHMTIETPGSEEQRHARIGAEAQLLSADPVVVVRGGGADGSAVAWGGGVAYATDEGGNGAI